MSTESSATEEQSQTDASFDVEAFEERVKGLTRTILMAVVVDGDTVEAECNFKTIQSGAAVPKKYRQVATAAAAALDGAESVEIVAHFGGGEINTARCTFEAAALEALAAGDLDDDAFRLRILCEIEQVI